MNRLVVPTDFSDFAQEALRFAVALRRRTGAEVHLLHVESPELPLSPEALVPPPSLPRAEITAALRQQAEVADTTASDLTFAIRTAYAVAPAILTYADEVGADAIVTGTHGRRGLRRMMLGSVAEELVRTAASDVLVTPLHEMPYSAHPARRILVPLDLREGSAALLAHARDLARGLDSERVDLLHVLEPLPYPVRWLDEAVLDVVPTIRERAAEALREMASGADLDPGGVYVERGRPERVIRRVAVALESDLLILAPHVQGRIERALLGSVAGEVARATERPVLIARSLSDETGATDSTVPASGVAEPLAS